jgi:hypothetical protein
MLEIAIALIVGFALGYGQRLAAKLPKRGSRSPAAIAVLRATPGLANAPGTELQRCELG